jgi:multidrug efflux pump subunit AcrB
MDRFIAFFVTRWRLTLIAVVLLAALGLNAALITPRSEDPHFPIPIFEVHVALPGASPIDVEELIVKPLENAFNGLDSVRDTYSTSFDGAGVVVIAFTSDVNADRKYDEVVREVNALRAHFPSGVTSVNVRTRRTTETSIVQLALVNDTLPMRRFEKLAAALRDEVARVPGVRQSEVWGAAPSEVAVNVDLARLAALQLPVTAVADTLRSAGADAPLGTLQSGQRRLNVTSGGAFRDLAQIEELPLRAPGGRVLRIGDVATAAWRTAPETWITRFNGRRALFITSTQRDDVDTISVTRNLERRVEAFRRTLPAGTTLEVGFLQSQNVKHRLSQLMRDFGFALLLVLLTLVPLGWRAGGVVMISIPLSLLIGMIGVQLFGVGLNQLTISGFVLSLGLLVDDAIVVTENISRRLRAGAGRFEAAVGGTSEIALAVCGCTATLMLAFLPLSALPGASGAFVRPLPVTVWATIFGSLLVALCVVPLMASRFLPAESLPEGNAALRAVQGAIHAGYRPIMAFGLRHPWRTLVVLGLLCTLIVPMALAAGSALFPPADTPQFLIQIEADQSASLSRTGRALAAVEGQLAHEPTVEWFASNLGRGNPQIYYNIAPHGPDTAYAEVFVRLRNNENALTSVLVGRLRRELPKIPGARIRIVTFEVGPPFQAPIAVRLVGPDSRVLQALAAGVESSLTGTPGIEDIRSPVHTDRLGVELRVDEDRAAALGAPEGAARAVLRTALSGDDAGRYRDTDGEEYPVRVRVGNGGVADIRLLNSLYVPTQSGAAAPLASLAHPTLRTAPAQIDRYNRERTVVVTASPAPGYLTSRVSAEAARRIAKDIEIPVGYRLEFGGEAEARAESFAGVGAAGIIALLGILGVLVVEFGSFRTAMVVAGIAPFGVLGAVCALWLTGTPLSFTAMVGIIALLGIETKNSILLVDLSEQLLARGASLQEAVERAGEVRFFPILLTSVTAIGGLLPLAMDKGAYSPLAIGVIGGLVSSTLLARLATPVLYFLVARSRLPRAERLHSSSL